VPSRAQDDDVSTADLGGTPVNIGKIEWEKALWATQSRRRQPQPYPFEKSEAGRGKTLGGRIPELKLMPNPRSSG
jgi:hypothetical protein